MPIEWKPYLATGVAEIDEQHKELFEKVNMLFEAAKRHEAKKQFNETLTFLFDYASFHFATEEQHFKDHDYPDEVLHVDIHAEFTSNINRIKQDVDQHGVSAATIIDTNTLIADWIVNHVGKADKAFGAFVAGKGD